jgi:hypothetical protein
MKATEAKADEKNAAEGSPFAKILDLITPWARKGEGERKGKKIGKPAEGEFTPDQEQLIKDNMDYYKKSREEIIAALRKKGKL